MRIKRQLPSSNEEKLYELWESTDKQLERERVPDQENWKNADRQRGIPIESNELVRRITALNPFVWAEDSINCPGHANFYFVKDGQKACAGAPFKRGVIFEFSRVYVDTTDRPVGIEYGWREVLHRLMKKKLIKWRQIVRNFPIYNSVRSEPFEQKTQDLRN